MGSLSKHIQHCDARHMPPCFFHRLNLLIGYTIMTAQLVTVAKQVLETNIYISDPMR